MGGGGRLRGPPAGRRRRGPVAGPSRGEGQGWQIGGYRLVERIAAGGMGEVWKAVHLSLARPVAVKLISPRLIAGLSPLRASSAERDFEREAQSTAALSSPHTVKLFDFGKTPDGTVYYVMELLGGLDLARLVRRFGPQPAARVVHVLLQICHSLAEAHRKGLVHRDIKPGNVRLTIQAGDFDFVKVLDFGLVKRRRGGRLSLDGSVKGTPGYLAPEVIERRRPADERADLYSLGCVAYRLLTGVPVFDATDPAALLRAHLDQPPLPPSLRLGRPLPFALESLVLELLAKSPDDRPQSAADVIGRLRAIAAELPWTQPEAERWWREHLPLELTHALQGGVGGSGELDLGPLLAESLPPPPPAPSPGSPASPASSGSPAPEGHADEARLEEARLEEATVVEAPRRGPLGSGPTLLEAPSAG